MAWPRCSCRKATVVRSTRKPTMMCGMLLETIATLFAAIAIVFSRLDRRADQEAGLALVRDGLLDLDDLLTRWIAAAERTAAALEQGDPAASLRALASSSAQEAGVDVGAETRLLITNQSVGLQVSRWSNDNRDGEDRHHRLRQLLDVYAPELADELRVVVSKRLKLLDFVLATEAIDNTMGPNSAAYADRLRASTMQLREARSQVRRFIATNFPLVRRV